MVVKKKIVVKPDTPEAMLEDSIMQAEKILKEMKEKPYKPKKLTITQPVCPNCKGKNKIKYRVLSHQFICACGHVMYAKDDKRDKYFICPHCEGLGLTKLEESGIIIDNRPLDQIVQQKENGHVRARIDRRNRKQD